MSECECVCVCVCVCDQWRALSGGGLAPVVSLCCLCVSSAMCEFSPQLRL